MLQILLCIVYVTSVMVVFNTEMNNFASTYQEMCDSLKEGVTEHLAKKNISNDEVTLKMVREIATVKTWTLILILCFTPILNTAIAYKYLSKNY